MKPSEPAKIVLNAVWGFSDTAKGKCLGSSVTLNLLGEVSNAQLQEANEDKWPYRECREESKEKQFTPFSDACYEVSKELSTLRKYQIIAKHENVSLRFHLLKEMNSQLDNKCTIVIRYRKI